MFKSLACCGSQPHHEARRPYAQMQDGQMMQTPAAKRQDVEGAQQQQQQQQQLVTAARAISAEATAAKKSRSDPLPSGKKARCRPSKDTMEGWGDTICSSTKKKPVGNAEDPMFKEGVAEHCGEGPELRGVGCRTGEGLDQARRYGREEA